MSVCLKSQTLLVAVKHCCKKKAAKSLFEYLKYLKSENFVSTKQVNLKWQLVEVFLKKLYQRSP